MIVNIQMMFELVNNHKLFFELLKFKCSFDGLLCLSESCVRKFNILSGPYMRQVSVTGSPGGKIIVRAIEIYTRTGHRRYENDKHMDVRGSSWRDTWSHRSGSRV